MDDCYELRELASELVDTACRLLEIGAHVGSLTVALASAVPGAEVTAFEPCTDRVSYLRRNIARNGLDWVAVVQAAGGDQASRAMLIGGEMVPGSTEADGDVVDVVGSEDVIIFDRRPGRFGEDGLRGRRA